MKGRPGGERLDQASGEEKLMGFCIIKMQVEGWLYAWGKELASMTCMQVEAMPHASGEDSPSWGCKRFMLIKETNK